MKKRKTKNRKSKKQKQICEPFNSEKVYERVMRWATDPSSFESINQWVYCWEIFFPLTNMHSLVKLNSVLRSS